MLWLEQKYLGLVSSRLKNYKQKNRLLWNFRCPFCGDSRTNPNKARGYIYKDKEHLKYKCHNCNITSTFDYFLKSLDNRLHDEFITEKIQINAGLKEKPDTREEFTEKMKTPKFIKQSFLKKLPKISQLPSGHFAKQYVVNRKIPNFWHSRLFFCDDFNGFVNSIIPNKMSDKKKEYRLIIPFINEEKKLIGFQGRSFLDNSKLKYITIMVEDAPKIFNLDLCDRTKDHLILEGPIDAMFCQNSIAMAGGSIDWNFVNDHSIFVYDNEPRKKETIKKIENVLKLGYRVSFFPNKIKAKDVNDVVRSQVKPVDISTYFYHNSVKGLEGLMKLQEWKRI